MKCPQTARLCTQKDELSRSDSRLIDEPLGETRLECDAMASVELVVLKTGGETKVKDGCVVY